MTSEQAQDLLAAMTALLEELPDHKAALRRAWKGTISAAIVGVTAVLMALTSHLAIVNVQEVRDSGLVAACFEQNELLDRQRNALKSGILQLAADPENLTEEEQRRYDGYVVIVDTHLQDRDCSPEAIMAYYSPGITGPEHGPPDHLVE